MKRISMLLVLAGCAHEPTAAPAATATPVAAAHDHAAAAPAQAAKLYDDLGAYHRAVTTRVPEAQRWFDQGLRLTYAFNQIGRASCRERV